MGASKKRLKGRLWASEVTLGWSEGMGTVPSCLEFMLGFKQESAVTQWNRKKDACVQDGDEPHESIARLICLNKLNPAPLEPKWGKTSAKSRNGKDTPRYPLYSETALQSKPIFYPVIAHEWLAVALHSSGS